MADAAPPTTQVSDPPAAPIAVEIPPEPPVEPVAQSEAAEQHEAEIDDIEKQIEPRTWIFKGTFVLDRNGVDTPQDFEGTYVQRPLSYFAFLEFTGLIARKIDEAMSGPEGLTIQQVMDSTQSAMPYIVDGSRIEAAVEQKKFDGIDSFIQGIAKLAGYVPDVIEECQFIWLRVPRRERVFLREIWGRSAEEGGMTADDGEEMLVTFIDQNYEELETFFVQRLPRMLKRTQAARARMQARKLRAGSRQSRPLSRTAEPTQSQ
jgi:hypothetical protein